MTKFFYSDIYLESSFSDYIIVEFKKNKKNKGNMAGKRL